MADRLLKDVIPMKGRMIHDGTGKQQSQLYGLNGEVRLLFLFLTSAEMWHAQSINSIDREVLNKSLLSEAESYPNVRLHFKHKLLRADFDGRRLIFERENGERAEVDADLTIGADGAYSKVREQMMRVMRYDCFFSIHPDHVLMLAIWAAGCSTSKSTSTTRTLSFRYRRAKMGRPAKRRSSSTPITCTSGRGTPSCSSPFRIQSVSYLR